MYHKIASERQDLKVSGCWVHARRPYAEFIKSLDSKAAKNTLAYEAYAMLTEIMHVDNGFDDLPISDRTVQRQLVLSKKVDAYFAWVKEKYHQVAHNSAIGKALAYSIHQEVYLRQFLTDGSITLQYSMQL